MVTHGHAYHGLLHEAVEDGVASLAPARLRHAAAMAVLPRLSGLAGPGRTPEAILVFAGLHFRSLGLGALRFDGLGPRGGEVLCVGSQQASTWRMTRGRRATPGCHFVAGFIAAAFAVAHGAELTGIHVRETRCHATQAEARGDCVFRVECSRS